MDYIILQNCIKEDEIISVSTILRIVEADSEEEAVSKFVLYTKESNLDYQHKLDVICKPLDEVSVII